MAAIGIHIFFVREHDLSRYRPWVVRLVILLTCTWYAPLLGVIDTYVNDLGFLLLWGWMRRCILGGWDGVYR